MDRLVHRNFVEHRFGITHWQSSYRTFDCRLHCLDGVRVCTRPEYLVKFSEAPIGSRWASPANQNYVYEVVNPNDGTYVQCNAVNRWNRRDAGLIQIPRQSLMFPVPSITWSIVWFDREKRSDS